MTAYTRRRSAAEAATPPGGTFPGAWPGTLLARMAATKEGTSSVSTSSGTSGSARATAVSGGSISIASREANASIKALVPAV